MHGRKQDVIEYYHKRAPSFGTHVATYADPELIRLCWEVLPEREYESVLDLAAGQGHFLADLFPGRKCNDKRAFLDLSETMLAEGVRKGLIFPEEAVHGDVDAGLPLRDGECDLVTCRYAWHDFRRQAEVAREVARVLTPGGVFLFVDMSVSPEMRGQTEVYNEIHSLKTGLPTNIMPQQDLQRLMARVGLRLLQCRWYSSQVSLTEWQCEGQISAEERSRVFEEVSASRHGRFTAFVDRVQFEPVRDAWFRFPVLVAAFSKEGCRDEPQAKTTG
jgi:ubiquinone/menaquinone biosynthesis C-methylase UbiE